MEKEEVLMRLSVLNRAGLVYTETETKKMLVALLTPILELTEFGSELSLSGWSETGCSDDEFFIINKKKFFDEWLGTKSKNYLTLSFTKFIMFLEPTAFKIKIKEELERTMPKWIEWECFKTPPKECKVCGRPLRNANKCKPCWDRERYIYGRRY